MYEESDRMPFIVRYPGVIRPGSTCEALGINCDFAPTFLDLAGQKTPADMQGRSLVPLFSGRAPADWRTSFYYRYYHDPGDHNTAAHYGVRTATHKLIYFWRKDQWECYDLTKDLAELHNIYNEPAAQPVVAELKKELLRLKNRTGRQGPVRQERRLAHRRRGSSLRKEARQGQRQSRQGRRTASVGGVGSQRLSGGSRPACS